MKNIPERKHVKRKSSKSPFHINIKSLYSQNKNDVPDSNSIKLMNPNYVNQSIYPGDSADDDYLNEIDECPNCLSYKQNINEKNLVIQKLQNQISNLNSSKSSVPSYIHPNKNLNNNNFKKIISDLKNELTNKDEQISQISFNYDEQINILYSCNTYEIINYLN